jgi:hypothetical protein
MKYVAGEDPARRRSTCPQYQSGVDGRKTPQTSTYALFMNGEHDAALYRQ